MTVEENNYSGDHSSSPAAFSDKYRAYIGLRNGKDRDVVGLYIREGRYQVVVECEGGSNIYRRTNCSSWNHRAFAT